MAHSSQTRLLPYENPLLKRLGKDFFISLPQTPGVYLMLGVGESILYVGKAGNLRARLSSYKRARPEQVSRKVIRLLHMVVKIHWEECKSEEDALLRENQLLREHRPPFNVVNTHPETYYMIALDFADPGTARFQLLTQPITSCEHLFGAFKGRGTIRHGYAALLRLLWLSQTREMERFEYPGALVRHNPPSDFQIQLNDGNGDWAPLLERFLRGTSRSLLVRFTAQFLGMEGIHPFYYRFIQEDLEALQNFFAAGPQRNRRLKRFHRRGSAFIAQSEIDDLLVPFRMERQRRKSLRHGS